MLKSRSWRYGGHLYVAATRVYHAWEGAVGLQDKESLWLETSSEAVYLKFDRFIVSSGFTRLEADHCYSKWFENSCIMLLLYVNDMLVAGSSMKKIVNLKSRLAEEFSTKDLNPAKKFLK